MSDASAKAPDDGVVYYRYEGRDGQVHLVDSLERVPKKYRAKAERLTLTPPNEAVVLPAEAPTTVSKASDLPASVRVRAVSSGELRTGVRDFAAFAKHLDVPSVAVGFGGGILAFVVAGLFRRTGRLLGKLALLAVVGMLVVGAYFGWLRRSAGLPGQSLISSPGAVLDDAKAARKQLEEHLKQQQKTLDALEAPPK